MADTILVLNAGSSSLKLRLLKRLIFHSKMTYSLNFECRHRYPIAAKAEHIS